MEVIFFQVNNGKHKLSLLTQLITSFFMEQKKQTVFTPNSDASAYIDSWLWSSPKESFLPHEISRETVNTPVVITEERTNLNKATVAINLCSEVIENAEAYEKVIEFIDQNDEKKLQLSRERYLHYKKQGIPCRLFFT